MINQIAKTAIYLFVFAVSSISFSQVLINADVRIDGFRHNHDCGNDGALLDQPDPRYKVWVGYDNANFNTVSNPPGLYSGCGSTYGADAVVCNSWNPGVINAASFNALPMTQLNIDMESWEEDACGNDCCRIRRHMRI